MTEPMTTSSAAARRWIVERLLWEHFLDGVRASDATETPGEVDEAA